MEEEKKLYCPFEDICIISKNYLFHYHRPKGSMIHETADDSIGYRCVAFENTSDSDKGDNCSYITLLNHLEKLNEDSSEGRRIE